MEYGELVGRPSLFFLFWAIRKEGRMPLIFSRKEERREAHIWGVKSYGKRRGGMESSYHMGVSSWLTPIPNRTQDLVPTLTNPWI